MNRLTKSLGISLCGVGALLLARRVMRKPLPDFRGQCVVITGGSRGLGLEMARIWAAQGAKVAICSRTAAEVSGAVNELSQFGKPVYGEVCDVTIPEQIEGFLKRVALSLGPIDVLVNNAGIQFVAPVDEFPVEKWDAILAINLSSAFHTSAAALPGMKAKGWGRIVNIASAHGLTASPFKSAYIAAKHGVVGLSKTVALEVAGQGITCNAICPGYVLTPLVEAQIPEQMRVHGMDRETVLREVMLLRQPSRQFATVDQIGGTTVFLCSAAADQVTGTTISVDGGWTAL